MSTEHQVQRSLRLMGQVITLHQTKKREMYGTDIQRYIKHQSQDKEEMHRRNQHKERCQVMSGIFFLLKCRVVLKSRVKH